MQFTRSSKVLGNI